VSCGPWVCVVVCLGMVCIIFWSLFVYCVVHVEIMEEGGRGEGEKRWCPCRGVCLACSEISYHRWGDLWFISSILIYHQGLGFMKKKRYDFLCYFFGARPNHKFFTRPKTSRQKCCNPCTMVRVNENHAWLDSERRSFFPLKRRRRESMHHR
jgi:hypothetical protein